MTLLKKQFGRRLRQLRRYKDFTQEQLAQAIGVSADQISNIERGINGPSFETLEKLAATLEVSVRDLFDFEHFARKKPE